MSGWRPYVHSRLPAALSHVDVWLQGNRLRADGHSSSEVLTILLETDRRCQFPCGRAAIERLMCSSA
jgi:hypothetical protein